MRGGGKKLFRLGCLLAASFLLGGCVGYGYPGEYGDPYGYGGSQSHPYPGGYANGSVRCESRDNRMQRCSADTRYGIRVQHQFSDSPCIQGRTWGYDRGGIWVSQGCRAIFVAGGGYVGSPYPGSGHGQGVTVRCESRDKRPHRCSASVHQGVQLQRKMSDADCIQGSTWGWDRDGIWVDHGCRADFLVY